MVVLLFVFFIFAWFAIITMYIVVAFWGHEYGSSFMYTRLENRLWLHNFVYGLHGSVCMCLLMGLCAGVRILS